MKLNFAHMQDDMKWNVGQKRTYLNFGREEMLFMTWCCQYAFHSILLPLGGCDKAYEPEHHNWNWSCLEWVEQLLCKLCVSSLIDCNDEVDRDEVAGRTGPIATGSMKFRTDFDYQDSYIQDLFSRWLTEMHYYATSIR